MFMIQGNKEGEWWMATDNQMKYIQPIYEQWKKGNDESVLNEHVEEYHDDHTGFKYLVKISEKEAFMQNLTHKDRRKRLIHFLPEHLGHNV